MITGRRRLSERGQEEEVSVTHSLHSWITTAGNISSDVICWAIISSEGQPYCCCRLGCCSSLSLLIDCHSLHSCMPANNRSSRCPTKRGQFWTTGSLGQTHIVVGLYPTPGYCRVPTLVSKAGKLQCCKFFGMLPPDPPLSPPRNSERDQQTVLSV